jgi:hypothetical protein
MFVRSERAIGVLHERGIELTPSELELLEDGPPYRQLGAIRLYRVGDLLAWGEERQRRPPAAATVVHLHVHLTGWPAQDPATRRRRKRTTATAA